MPSARRAMTEWATKGPAVALAAAALLSLAAVGCAAPPPEPIDLVPADANLVASIELSSLLTDPDLASAFESAPHGEDGPASLDEKLAEVQAETGIDLRSFSRVIAFGIVDPTIAGDGATLGAGEEFAILARGTFNGDAILDRVRLEAATDVREDEYRGHALLLPDEEDGTQTAMTLLADDVFVFGTLGAVTSVIDVLEDGEGALSGPPLDTYVALGDPLVKVAFAVPAGSLEYIVAEPTDAFPIPFDPSLISDVRIVGFASDKEADVVTATVTLEYTSAASAEDASEFFGALLTLAAPFLPPGAAVDLLDLIEISHVDTTVTISVSATADQLSAAAEELGELASSLIPG